jgi:hypothetical protein
MQTDNAYSQSPGDILRPAPLAENLNHKLFNYAAAASAAGVSLLALAHPAEAKVIYTAVNLPINVNGGLVTVDINNDGVPDFGFYNGIFSGARAPARKPARPPLGFYAHDIYEIALQPGGEVGAITSFNKAVCVAELPQGKTIDGNKNFQGGSLDLFAVAGDYTSPGTADCPWQGKGNKGGFMAVKFVVGSNTYYGWIRIRLETVPTITGFAYENAPGVSITTGSEKGPEAAALPLSALPGPQPASLGLLATGTQGLVAWRKTEEMN